MDKYKGKEQELIDKLNAKYGAGGTSSPASPKAPSEAGGSDYKAQVVAILQKHDA
eukprot:gene26885-biopygen17470